MISEPCDICNEYEEVQYSLAHRLNLCVDCRHIYRRRDPYDLWQSVILDSIDNPAKLTELIERVDRAYEFSLDAGTLFAGIKGLASTLEAGCQES